MGTFIFPKEIVADKGYKVILLKVKKIKMKWNNPPSMTNPSLHISCR